MNEIRLNDSSYTDYLSVRRMAFNIGQWYNTCHDKDFCVTECSRVFSRLVQGRLPTLYCMCGRILPSHLTQTEEEDLKEDNTAGATRSSTAPPHTPQCYLAGAVEVLLLLGELVEGEEGVGVARRAVTDTVTFPQQASLPDHLPTLHSILQVLLILKHLEGGRKGET